MDERFRGKKHWIGLGALAIIFLCLALCGLGAMATVVLRSGPAHGVALHLQPSAGEEGAAPSAGCCGPMGRGQVGHWGPFGFIFGGIRLLIGLAVLGLLLLLIVGLARRVFWGRRHWGPPPWTRSPEGKEGEGTPCAWGPWAWHHHGRQEGPVPEPTGKEGESQAAEE
jgi:hypothetical protein